MESNGLVNNYYPKSLNVPFSTSNNGLSIENNFQNYTFSYSEDNSIQNTFNNEFSNEDIHLNHNQIDKCSIIFEKNDINSSQEINKKKTSALSSALRASHQLSNIDSNNNNNQNNGEVIVINNKNYNYNKTNNDDSKPPKSIDISTNILSNNDESEKKTQILNASTNKNKLSLIPYDNENNIGMSHFTNSETNLLSTQENFILFNNSESLQNSNGINCNETFNINRNKNIICKSCQKKIKEQFTKNHDNFISLNLPVNISNVNSIDIIGAGNDRNSITTNTLNRMLNSPSYNQLSFFDEQHYSNEKSKLSNNNEELKVMENYYNNDEFNKKTDEIHSTLKESPKLSNNNLNKYDLNYNKDVIKQNNNDRNNYLISKKIYSLSLNDSDYLKNNNNSFTPLNTTANIFENEIALFHPNEDFTEISIEKGNSYNNNDIQNNIVSTIPIQYKKQNNNFMKKDIQKFGEINKEDNSNNNDINNDNNYDNNNDNNNNNNNNGDNEVNPHGKVDRSENLIIFKINNEKKYLSRIGNESKSSFGDDDIGVYPFKNEDDLIDKSSPTSLPLLPYGHQVGGHAPFLRFSDKALCKLMNPKEKAFYESINNIYPELRPFIPGYYGVINVYFNNSGNLGNNSSWADTIPVAVFDDEPFNKSFSLDSALSKSSSQSLSISSRNNYSNHNHSCKACGKSNISSSLLSNNNSEITLNNSLNNDKEKAKNIDIKSNNKKIPVKYLTSYTNDESNMHYNYYQKLRERVLRDALTVQNRRNRYSQLRASSIAKLKRRHSMNALNNNGYQEYSPLQNNNTILRNNLNNNLIEQNINPWSLHCLNNQINKLDQNDKENQKPQQFILIEDLTYGMKYPCILDLKMGTRQHGVDATPQKRKSQEKKCESTTSKLFGVRMCGMQVYKTTTKTFEYSDKYKGRKIEASHFKEGLLSFLDNGEKVLVGFIPKIIEKLKTLYSVVEKLNTSRFYASSLMLFYDGAWVENEEETNNKNNNNNSNSKNNSNDIDDDSYSTVQQSLKNKEVVVHLIDFAHCTNEAHLMVSTDPKKRDNIDVTKPVINPVTGKPENYILVPFPPTHKGPDRGYLLGVGNLIMFFEEIYKDFGANGHVYKKDYPEFFNSIKNE
ncbi:SAICAR synthase-like protein [Neocallimastix lanati (nom. inval.)]|nr:SAICAR synthase-like protein [Neocallimastix sp. JGI-2020a]